MSIDILDMRNFDTNTHAIDIAFPVLAIECEVRPPLNNYLDAYEDAVLRLVSLGLSTNGISKTLNVTISLTEEILTHLENKQYVERKIGKPWLITKAGGNYLNGYTEERASSESVYGYMFINSIRKEVLPFFLQGDIRQIALFRGSVLPLKLTVGGSERETFDFVKIKQSKLRKAFKAYFKNRKTVVDYDDGDITKEEAVELFVGIESFDDALDENDNNVQSEVRVTADKDNDRLKENMFIRDLKKDPLKLYLRMRIIIDPTYPGGYRTESPLDFDGIDNDFFLRQIQWLEQADNIFLGREPIQSFLQKEICKLSPLYKHQLKDFQVYLLEKAPLLKIYRSKIPYVYDDLERIYVLIQRQRSLLDKENIVNNLARCVVEGLFNVYFKTINQKTLDMIKQNAFNELRTYGHENYKKRICGNIHLNDAVLKWVSESSLKAILKRLNTTYGNSIMEKFINMLAVEFHLGDIRVHRFLQQSDIAKKYDLIDELNKIRRKVSHDTEFRFTDKDYEFYMANVYILINGLLEALEGGLNNGE